MTVERKSWKPLYRMISEGQITEKEAYDIACGIFFQNIQYVPVPTPIVDDNNTTENTVEVKGFVNNQ